MKKRCSMVRWRLAGAGILAACALLAGCARVPMQAPAPTADNLDKVRTVGLRSVTLGDFRPSGDVASDSAQAVRTRLLVSPVQDSFAQYLKETLSVELKHAVEEATGVSLPLPDLLEGMTLRDLELYLEKPNAGGVDEEKLTAFIRDNLVITDEGTEKASVTGVETDREPARENRPLWVF